MMPIANSEDKDQGLPVVSQGEDLQVWLKRAVPALVDMGTPEDQAIELATEAWNRVNGQDKFARADKPATDKPEPEAEKKPDAAPKAEPKPDEPATDKPEPKAEPKAEADKPAQDEPRTEQPQPAADKPAEDTPRAEQPEPDDEDDQPETEGGMTWDQATWGSLEGAGTDAETESEDAPATGEAENESDAALDDDNYAALQPAGEGDIGGWYTGQIMNFAQALGAHLLDNGLVSDEQLASMVEAVMQMATGLESDLAQRMAPPKETKFTYDVALPDFARKGAPATQQAPDPWAATKTVAGPQMPYVSKFPNVRSPISETLAIKALGRNRVGSYLCVWGNPNRRDLSGEYFTPNTQEMTAIFDAIGTIPAIYHHALDNTVKSAVIGLVDVMKKDDVGLWIEAQVREHAAYKNLIKPLVDDHVLGWSSGALPGGRQVNKATGEITRWPIVEASMTPSPMEWRMAAQWPVQNIKAVYQQAGLPFNVVSKALRPKPPQASLDAEIAAELELLRILELS
jgi:outer membrane biosynthesis protein TonB